MWRHFLNIFRYLLVLSAILCALHLNLNHRIAFGQTPAPTPPTTQSTDENKPEPAGPDVSIKIIGPDAPLRIADKTNVSIELTHSSTYVFEGIAPTPANNARMRLNKQDHTSQTLPTGEIVQRFDYEVQMMATGRFYFKSMTFTLIDGNKKPRTIDSPTLGIKVSPTLDAKPEDAEPRPPRGPLQILEADPRPYYIGAGLLVILLLIPGFIHAWRRRKALRDAVEAAGIPRLPPWEEAKERMAALREANLVERDERLFCFELSDIFRDYLVRRYALSAPELTSSEILQQLRALAWAEGTHLSRIENILLDCDLVKFARFNPGADQSLRLLAETDTLLDLTQPPPEPATPAEGIPETPIDSKKGGD